MKGLVARGFTGQTAETFDPNWNVATSATNLPYSAPGSAPSGLANDFDCGTVKQAVGIRMRPPRCYRLAVVPWITLLQISNSRFIGSDHVS